MVRRLDKDTSGAILVERRIMLVICVAEMLQNRTIGKCNLRD